MKRRLFNLLAGASLLLCVATAALWVRSIWRSDCFIYRNDRHYSDRWTTWQHVITSADGGISLCFGSGTVDNSHTATIKEITSEVYKWHPKGFEFVGQPATEYPFGWANFPSTWWRRLGFEFGNDYQWSGPSKDIHAHYVWIVFPHWFATLILGILPSMWIFTNRRRRRSAALGLCPTCDYDLRATPQGGRCPECGLIPPQKNMISN